MSANACAAYLAEYDAKFDATRIRVPYMRTMQTHDTGNGPLIVNRLMPSAPVLNEYANAIGGDLWESCPKAVFAAIAVSALTCGGDHLGQAHELVAEEWCALFDAGIVTQRPPSHVRIAASRVDA